VPVGQGAAVSVDGILPSETSELYTDDHLPRSEVAQGGVKGGCVVVCARASGVAAAAAARARVGFILEGAWVVVRGGGCVVVWKGER